jgi:hypothetical protein
VTPQFGVSLADNSRVIIYDHNMFIVQATGNMSHVMDLPGLVLVDKRCDFLSMIIECSMDFAKEMLELFFLSCWVKFFLHL